MNTQTEITNFLNSVLEAHGGIKRWQEFNRVSAMFSSSGALFSMKGVELPPTPLKGIATIHEEGTVIFPYGNPDWILKFTPNRVAIETVAGQVVEERSNPRKAFEGHAFNTSWDRMHRGYFNGYARWTYLNTPFFMALPGFEVEEIEPWREGSETWRGLRVVFPEQFASHSRVQDFYFGPDFLLRRHDYKLEIAGGIPIAQYVYDIVEANGFRFPSKRRAYVTDPNGKPVRDLLLISIDLSEFEVS